jgi:hypothetical protein
MIIYSLIQVNPRMSSDAHLHGNTTSLVEDTMRISKKFIGAVEDEWQLYRLAIVLIRIILFPQPFSVILLQIISLVYL